MARRLGRNIAAYRRRATLTQEQLAYRIDVEIATISRYETAAALPSLVTLERLAHTLHCSVAQLLDEKAPTRSAEIERVEAMIEPLDLDERALVVNLLESAVAFVRLRKVGRPRKRPAKDAADLSHTRATQGDVIEGDAANADAGLDVVAAHYVEDEVVKADTADDPAGKPLPTN
jgi:transcriptional regulator with XRE-family HTH domain